MGDAGKDPLMYLYYVDGGSIVADVGISGDHVNQVRKGQGKPPVTVIAGTYAPADAHTVASLEQRTGLKLSTATREPLPPYVFPAEPVAREPFGGRLVNRRKSGPDAPKPGTVVARSAA